MNYKHTILSIAFIFISFIAFSQNEVDALRYSWIGTGGTARYQSLGGAMGAVGGDPSCMSVNPAGLARYTKSDITLSIAHANISTNVEYNNNVAYNGKGSLTLNNLAAVFAFKNPEENEWKSVQFAIGYHKLANFNNAIFMKGENPNNSLLDQFAADASGVAPTALGNVLPFTSSLAYETYTIDPDPMSTNNEYTTQLFGSGVIQSRSINKSGTYGETNISMSGNYLDKFYIGASIGFPSLRYYEYYTHSETPTDSLNLISFDYIQDLYTKGNGINFKIGGIYTPVEWLRLGLALQTASSIGLTDEWHYEMKSEFNDDRSYDTISDIGLYNYRLKTPGRITASAAFIISKWGLVSVDYEYLDYSRAKFKKENSPTGSGYSFSTENLTIQNIYSSTSNLRIGMEGRYHWVSLRGGFAMYGSPFKDEATTVDATRYTYSAGLGLRLKGFYADLGWSITKWSEAYFMYDPILVNTAKINTAFKQFNVTMGFRF